MFRVFVLALVGLLPVSVFGALTEEQRVQDFQTLTAIYAKKYGPANWKIQSLGVNIFDVGPWVKRVRAAKNDLEFIEVMMRYVASFQDSHDNVSMTSNFVARLGMALDLYDGKTVIDFVDRAVLPLATYPFVAGDELVSIDGVPALEIAQGYTALLGWGNPRAGLRYAVQQVTIRPQSLLPRAIETPGESAVRIRHQNGNVETYQLPWVKTGYPVREIGGVPTPGPFKSGLRIHEPYIPSNSSDAEAVPTWKRTYFERNMLSVNRTPGDGQVGQVETEDGVKLEPEGVLNFGSRFPWFVMPAGFQQRLGSLGGDVFFSGVYQSEGLRMGYLRIPNFPTYTMAQYAILDAEMAYMNANTDGLVVDVARNTGGSLCATVEVAGRLIPGGFKYLGLAFRPTLAQIVNYDNVIANARAQNAPNWVIENYSFEKAMMESAYYDGRGLTGSVPVCNWTHDYPSSPSAYRKPMIMLVDDFSTSGGDYLPALIQDNKRAKLVGTRTNGAGGSVIGQSAGWYSETNTAVTVSLIVRLEERQYDAFPKSPFLENVGVRPDIELDYMTVENAANLGRPYSAAFTRILADEIRRLQ